MLLLIVIGLAIVYVGGIVVAAMRTQGAITFSWPRHVWQVIEGKER